MKRGEAFVGMKRRGSQLYFVFDLVYMDFGDIGMDGLGWLACLLAYLRRQNMVLVVVFGRVCRWSFGIVVGEGR